MKLLYVIAAILAISLADTKTKKREIDDSEAAESVELLKERTDLKSEASTYNLLPSQKPPKWTSIGYVPPLNWGGFESPKEPVNNWIPPTQPINSWKPPQNPISSWNPPQNPISSWNPPQNPVSSWNPPQNPVTSWNPPQNPISSWNPAQIPAKEPTNTWNPPKDPVNTWVPPVQSDYIPPQQHTTTTTPVPVIKNEQHYYDNGAYKYEYQIGDGTHVGEEGYYSDTKQDDDSVVKKGWYSFVGADGKTYTVTYWADKTGFHAYGDHLPTPPPVPAAIQAALDKEKENELSKPQQDYYTTQAPQQVYYPTQAPAYVPPKQPTYVPPQPSNFYPSQPTYNPVQPTYPTYS